MIRYRCSDCGAVFDHPVIGYETYDCRGSFVSQEFAYCPQCYGWALELYDDLREEYERYFPEEEEGGI